MNIEQTISDLSSLPIAERLLVIQTVWDSIPSDVVLPVSPEQQAELERRIAAHDADPATAISREQLKRRLKGSE